MGTISDKLDKDLSEHPDTITVELAGEELPWFIGRRTFGLVRRHPGQETTFSSILDDAMDAQDGAAEQVDKMARIMWAGFLPFESDLSFDLVADMISFGDLPRLQQVLDDNFGKLRDLAEQEEDLGKGQGEPTPTEKIPEAAKTAAQSRQANGPDQRRKP